MAELKHYVLKAGRKHSYVQGDEAHNVVGDGKGTIPLNDTQAKNFADKIESKPVKEAVAFAVSATEEAVESGKPVEGISPGASAAAGNDKADAKADDKKK